jgi:integrase
VANQDAQRRESKKSPNLGSVAALAEAWAEAYPRHSHQHDVAKDLRATFGDTALWKVTSFALNSLITRWRQKYAHATAYCRLCSLKQWTRHVHAYGGPNLTRELQRMAKPQPRETTATLEERAALHRHAAPWLRVWLLLCENLGLRFSTAAAIAPQNYNAERGEITIITKRKKVLVLPVPDELQRLFAAVDREANPTIPYWMLLRGDTGLRGSIKHPNCSLRAEWERCKKKAGVRVTLRPHDLRRTLAVELYEATKDIRAVQLVLGHESLATTASYLHHRDPQKLRALLAQLWTPKGGPVQ